MRGGENQADYIVFTQRLLLLLFIILGCVLRLGRDDTLHIYILILYVVLSSQKVLRRWLLPWATPHHNLFPTITPTSESLQILISIIVVTLRWAVLLLLWWTMLLFFRGFLCNPQHIVQVLVSFGGSRWHMFHWRSLVVSFKMMVWGQFGTVKMMKIAYLLFLADKH